MWNLLVYISFAAEFRSQTIPISLNMFSILSMPNQAYGRLVWMASGLNLLCPLRKAVPSWKEGSWLSLS